jgi:hypothetical protein
MINTASKRLQKLAKINDTKKYLEVGVQQGNTFHSLDFIYQVAVDPQFEFSEDSRKLSNSIYFEMTSDEFWACEQVGEKFDLIFLDGLHTFDQTFRDFCASINFSHDQTIWVIDDVLPNSFLASLPDLSLTIIARKFLPFSGTQWMGDCYKVVCAIHDYFPQYRYATFEEHGQTVVWKGSRKNFSPKFNSMTKISKLNYFNFLKIQKKNILNVMEEDRIIDEIKRDFS